MHQPETVVIGTTRGGRVVDAWLEGLSKAGLNALSAYDRQRLKASMDAALGRAQEIGQTVEKTG